MANDSTDQDIRKLTDHQLTRYLEGHEDTKDTGKELYPFKYQKQLMMLTGVLHNSEIKPLENPQTDIF